MTTRSFLVIFLYMKFLTHLLVVFTAAVQVASVRVVLVFEGGPEEISATT